MGKIIIFYKYITIEQPQAICKWQKAICQELGLKGRILIATEGINATIGGSNESIERYKNLMLAHPLFGGIDFKESPGEADHFPRLRVVVRPEIVHLGLDTEKITAKDAGTHLTPQEAHAFMAQMGDDAIVLDTRNSYEWKIGQFKTVHTINTQTEYFREFPEFIDSNIETFKDKKILMACTSGVRCERASAYLKSKNVAKEVYQINGGIQRYTEEFPEGFFRGKNYVFDGRITMKINNDCVGNCDRCNAPYDEPINCINAECNKQILMCDACQLTLINTCSELCAQLVRENKVKIRTKPKKVSQASEIHESDSAQCSLT